MICRKNLTATPARLQHMLLRLQPYYYSIVYRPGKEMVLPECLSHLPKNRTNNDVEVNLNMKICHVQFSNEKIDALRKATKNNVLSTLMQYTIHGFPGKQHDIPKEIRNYWLLNDELSIKDGLVLFKVNELLFPKHYIIVPELRGIFFTFSRPKGLMVVSKA